MTTQTWFVTGSSRGLGESIARAALAAGHHVAATARRPEQLAGLTAEFGDRVLPLALDVTDLAQAEAALAATTARFGRIDVVVNNAGYANLAPIETADVADFRAQFETNFWGVYNVSRAALPILRAQQGGLLVQISSVGGRVGGSPGLGSYQAAKFAVDGFSRVLRAEVAPFGVKVLVVEPSGFRTDWAGSSMEVEAVPEAYATTVGARAESLRAGQISPGVPERAGEIIVRVAQLDELPEHLPLGVVSSEWGASDGERLVAESRAWAAVSRSADEGEPYPAELPV
ncbi:SDR family NAD(P)-dependent oxidoreductase [Microbacterium stercoris]|uniref:SDR family NAD(P)-dependent oxidoreductase n=1 Tax=Microbacterium stercoris TaxID=2820289 RepID=A0A939TS69_9MICO|nr:SDR family NAD(P)-dependent oxidoreductase [Microbacterium stercoris]MBO3664891.1 SDR family NAD(P)-dependent oxidoreductase [Microbacterium stercoris]